MTFCNENNDERMCNKCNIQVKEKKEFETNLYPIRKEAHNEFSYLLPYYKLKFLIKKVIRCNKIHRIRSNNFIRVKFLFFYCIEILSNK